MERDGEEEKRVLRAKIAESKSREVEKISATIKTISERYPELSMEGEISTISTGFRNHPKNNPRIKPRTSASRKRDQRDMVLSQPGERKINIRAGDPAAPGLTFLPLLPLGPDGVRKVPPRWTHPDCARIPEEETTVNCLEDQPKRMKSRHVTVRKSMSHLYPLVKRYLIRVQIAEKASLNLIFFPSA